MGKVQDDMYYKGYIAGYKDGIKDGAEGKTIESIESSIGQLPLAAMGLSARAYNCMKLAGCRSVEDIAKLDKHCIATMRNLGPKTSSEIARWLDAHEICFSAWSEYL